MFETIGGIYVAPTVNGKGQDVVESLCHEFGARKVAVLNLTLAAGTRFCLDEDFFDDAGTVVERELEGRYGHDFGPDTFKLIKRALRYARGRDKRGEWSCRLAHALDQRSIDYYALRIFDPPIINRVDIVRCP
jgi:hypothetical protein